MTFLNLSSILKMDGKVSTSTVLEVHVLKFALDVINLYHSNSSKCRVYVHINLLYLQKILM